MSDTQVSSMTDVLVALGDIKEGMVKAVYISDYEGPKVIEIAHLGQPGEATVLRTDSLRFESETGANLFFALALDLLERPRVDPMAG